MVMVSNMELSIDFYQNKLGLQLKFSSDFWTEFTVGETTLALHGGAMEKEGTEKGDAGNCSFGFYVEDVESLCNELQTKGVKFSQKPEQRENEGIILSTCLDPDGLPISITQKL